MLRIEGLTKTYKNGRQGIVGCIFDVPKGQVVGLIGPSGAGKSTLIRCINRLVEPKFRRGLLNDINLPALRTGDLRRARRRIGMIFQEYALVERLTVMENVLSGRLGYVGFWRSFTRRYPARILRMPIACWTVWADGACRQARRCAVGRAAPACGDRARLGARPGTAADRRTDRQPGPQDQPPDHALIVEICRERGLPAIINIHDVVLAQQFSDRIIGLQSGRVVFDGPPLG
jgi:phosphonate transport system ATP-binding protein